MKYEAIRGFQGGIENFLVQIPLSRVADTFIISGGGEDLKKQFQRKVNELRAADIAKYISLNKASYVLPTVVAFPLGESVDFNPISENSNLGFIDIQLGEKLAIFDGQHRISGIMQALESKENMREKFGGDTISVLLLGKRSLQATQQVFSDININAVKPSQSIKLLYNNRDLLNKTTRHIIESIPLFSQYTDWGVSNVSKNSEKVFTFSSIYSAVSELFNNLDGEAMQKIALIKEFFNLFIEGNISYQSLLDQSLTPVQLREHSLLAFSVTLQGIANFGKYIIKNNPNEWQQLMTKLHVVNWSKVNPIWRNRVIEAGKIRKSKNNSVLIANVLIESVGLELKGANRSSESNFNQLNLEA